MIQFQIAVSCFEKEIAFGIDVPWLSFEEQFFLLHYL
jgi:hypothetical protein